MAGILDILSWICFGLGGFLVIVSGLGLLRFPDFYSRLHAGGITDTFGADLILLGMMFQADSPMVVIKLLLIFLFLILTSPVSTHAVAHAAYVGHLRPRLGKSLEHGSFEPPSDGAGDGEGANQAP